MCLARMAGAGAGARGDAAAASASYFDGTSSPGLPLQLASKRNMVSGLPSMGVSTAAAPPTRLATLDWPPPPSPAHARQGASRTSSWHVGGLGATTLAAAGQDRRACNANRPAEIKARAELWALRGQIEREKLRSVPPYPFFGRSMRFQDEFSALQITDDGRFSYSTVSFDQPTAADSSEQRTGSAGTKGGRRVTTYEGVFVTPPEGEVGTPEHHASGSAGAHGGNGASDSTEEKGATSSRGDMEVAAIEGKAIACHVIVEEGGGRTRLESVSPGLFRFSITVSPFYNPTGATVQPLVQPRSPGRPPPRRRQLPYVGTGSGSAGRRSASGSLSPPTVSGGTATLNVAAAAELRQTRRRGPRLKFSSSAASLLPASPTQESGLVFFTSSGVAPALKGRSQPRTLLRRLSQQSASAPTLPALPTAAPAEKLGAGGAGGDGGESGKPMTAADWRDYYRERAKNVLSKSEVD